MPQQRDSGLYVAKTLAAAVEGDDPERSWFQGTVVQVGPEVVDRLDAVYPGDRVVFSWSVGHEVWVDGAHYIIVRHPDILAVVDEE